VKDAEGVDRGFVCKGGLFVGYAFDESVTPPPCEVLVYQENDRRCKRRPSLSVKKLGEGKVGAP
jgi:hypothetical protein